MTDNSGPDNFNRSFPEHKFILKYRKPVPEPDLYKWGKWFENTYRYVRKTYIDDIFISTVFLGLDHSFSSQEYPILFETMIFRNGESFDYQTRCQTWRQALKMHWQAVKWVKKGLL